MGLNDATCRHIDEMTTADPPSLQMQVCLCLMIWHVEWAQMTCDQPPKPF